MIIRTNENNQQSVFQIFETLDHFQGWQEEWGGIPRQIEKGAHISRDIARIRAVGNKKYSATNFLISSCFCTIDSVSHFTLLDVAMASVYKSVSKKAARQPTEDMSDEDIEMEELLDVEDDTTDSEEDSDDGEPAEVVKKQLASGFMPKTRVLILTSRGASYR